MLEKLKNSNKIDNPVDDKLLNEAINEYEKLLSYLVNIDIISKEQYNIRWAFVDLTEYNVDDNYCKNDCSCSGRKLFYQRDNAAKITCKKAYGNCNCNHKIFTCRRNDNCKEHSVQCNRKGTYNTGRQKVSCNNSH